MLHTALKEVDSLEIDFLKEKFHAELGNNSICIKLCVNVMFKQNNLR